MVLTEAFAAGTPVVAVGHRRLPRRRARRRRRPAHPARRRARARGGAARAGARPGAARADGGRRPRARRALRLAARRRRGARGLRAGARCRAGLQLRADASRCATASRPPTCSRACPPSACPARSRRSRSAPVRRALRVARRGALAAVSLVGLALALTAPPRIGVGRVLASLVASSPGLIAAGLGLMCLSMVVRGLAWHAILARRPHLAARAAARRAAGDVHRRADVRHPAGPPGRALACADRRAPHRAPARDAAGGARHDGLADAAEPARAGAARGGDALRRRRSCTATTERCCSRALLPRRGAARRAARPRAAAPLGDLPLRAAALAGGRAAPLAAAGARGPAHLPPAAPGGRGHDGAALARGRCSAPPAGCC